ncbi:hypothetical protein E2C01_049987 [Portunus trituberculatus]|uniref:Uncharacterized protein n=1 Tax=Portunus trituberculatus TaxID=210409 RepID=A0A5B7GG16_PORTR|nr:hypothetical protein [Portunus trituberculatus]
MKVAEGRNESGREGWRDGEMEREMVRVREVAGTVVVHAVEGSEWHVRNPECDWRRGWLLRSNQRPPSHGSRIDVSPHPL